MRVADTYQWCDIKQYPNPQFLLSVHQRVPAILETTISVSSIPQNSTKCILNMLASIRDSILLIKCTIVVFPDALLISDMAMPLTHESS